MTEKNQLPAPDWHDRPTGPGLWLCVGGEHLRGRVEGMDFTQADLDRGAPFYTSRVYGPIPPDPQRQS